MFDLLWEEHIHSRVGVMAFHDLFMASKATDTSAGWVFENRTHQLFLEGRTIGLFPIGGHRATVNAIYDDYSATKARTAPRNSR